MKNKQKEKIYTYIANYRGGAYCSQVGAKNVGESLKGWIVELEKNKDEIKFLGPCSY